jgi:hypothetical protein
MLGQMLGFDPAALTNQLGTGLARLMALQEASLEKTGCLDQRLTDLLRVLSLEYGLPVDSVRGHDPNRFPEVHLLGTDAAAAQAYGLSLHGASADLYGMLAKPVTRGFAQNLGSAAAVVVFRRRDRPAAGVRYVLAPSQILDFSWVFDSLEVLEAGEGPVLVQVSAQ